MDQGSSKHSTYPFVRVPRILLDRYKVYQETHPFGPSMNQLIQEDLEACPPIDVWVRAPKSKSSDAGEMATVRVTRDQLERMMEFQRSIRECAVANVTITDILTARLLYARANVEEKSTCDILSQLKDVIETGGVGYGTWTIGYTQSNQLMVLSVVGRTKAPLIRSV